jgi:TM2 domain-containing membrane protein YozV
MPELGVLELSEMTRDLDDNKKMIFNQQYQSEKKDAGTVIILAIFGFDRFWLGDIGLGLLKYFTAGGCGIWWLVDLFTAKSRCDDYNRRKAFELLQAMRLMH